MKKTISISGLLLAISLSTAISCNAQSVHTDDTTQMSYVNVSPYLRQANDVDTVRTMWIVSTTFNGTSASCWYELRSASGAVILHDYFSIDGDNYADYADSKWSDTVLMAMLAAYCKNTPIK